MSKKLEDALEVLTSVQDDLEGVVGLQADRARTTIQKFMAAHRKWPQDSDRLEMEKIFLAAEKEGRLSGFWAEVVRLIFEYHQGKSTFISLQLDLSQLIVSTFSTLYEETTSALTWADPARNKS